MNETAPAVEAAPAEPPVSSEAPQTNEGGSFRQDASNVPDSGFQVPDAFADRKWAGNLKSEEDLYNQFDNLQSMVGKKSVPAGDATDEQWEEFYSQLRPESHEAYELVLPDGIEADINQEEQAAAREFFHKNGFTQKQAQALFEFDIQRRLASVPDEGALDAQFDELMSARFGDGANDAIKVAHTHLSTQSQEVKDAFSQAPPELMAAVIDIINSNHNMYAREDISPETGATSGGSQTTKEALDELTRQRIEAKNMMPGSDRDEALEKIKIQIKLLLGKYRILAPPCGTSLFLLTIHIYFAYNGF